MSTKSIEALALVGGYVDDELLIRNEYLAAEKEMVYLLRQRETEIKPGLILLNAIKMV